MFLSLSVVFANITALIIAFIYVTSWHFEGLMGFLAIQILSDHTRCAHCTNVGSQESVPKMKMLRKKLLFCGEECQFQVGTVATI